MGFGSWGAGGAANEQAGRQAAVASESIHIVGRGFFIVATSLLLNGGHGLSASE
jgi:hypothetical protein